MSFVRMLLLIAALTVVAVNSSDAQQAKPTEVYGSAIQVDAGKMQLLVSKIVPNPGAIPNSLFLDISKQTRFEKVMITDGKKKTEAARAADAQGHDVIVTLKPGGKFVPDKVTILPDK